MTDSEHKQALPPGYELAGHRLIEVLGVGGFGVTYLARDTRLGRQVAIKEFLPNEFAVRAGQTVHPKSRSEEESFAWGLERFLDEARTLARFRHPNLVRVLDYFEVNQTAYIVMDYEEGESLSDILRRQGKLDEKQLRGVLFPILDGLSQMHAAGYLHRDIKPSNVFVREADGSPVLLDFGSARQALSRKSRSLTAVASAGYSPPEQYETDGEQGPWTDIYSLSALCYLAITGEMPVEAPGRMNRLAQGRPDPLPKLARTRPAGYSRTFLEAVDLGLSPIPSDRPSSLAEWVPFLKGARLRVRAAPAPSASVSPWPGWVESLASYWSAGLEVLRAQWPDSLRGRVWMAAAAGTLAMGALLWIWSPGEPDPPPAPPPAEEEASPFDDAVPWPPVRPDSQGTEDTPVTLDSQETGPSEGDLAVASEESPEPAPVSPAPRPPPGPAPATGVLGGNALLVVETTPSGVEVLVDGESVGETPLERSDIRAGVRDVTLEHPHYGTVRIANRTFEEGVAVRVDRVLERGAGRLTVTATPRAAWVEVNGERLAEDTPVTLEDLPAGYLDVRLGAPMHRPLAVRVEIPKDGVADLERALDEISWVPVCDRTPVVRDLILDRLEGVSACGDVTNAHLTAIGGIVNFAGRGVTELSTGDFDGLASVRGVNLSDNALATLPADVFRGLGSLVELRLSDNRLTALPANLFEDLSSLQRLYVGNNSLTSLPADLFERLGNLRGLSLFGNALTRLSADQFRGLDNLLDLSLFGNRLTIVPVNAFRGLESLQGLNLSDNALTRLPANVFRDLGSLQELNLVGNDLATLPAALVEDLRRRTDFRIRLEGNPGYTGPGPFDFRTSGPAGSEARSGGVDSLRGDLRLQLTAGRERWLAEEAGYRLALALSSRF